MFRFWKNNSRTISKLLITQFGMTVFGILLYSAASVANNSTLVTVFSLFSVVFYLFLLYTALWDVGAKDKIRIEGKRLSPRPFHGLLVALCANIPNLLFSVLSSIGYFAIDRSMNFSGKYVSPEWAVNLYAVVQVVGSYINAMYLGLNDKLGITVYPYSLALNVLPSLLVCFLGYYFGTKEKFPIVPENTKKNNY